MSEEWKQKKIKNEKNNNEKMNDNEKKQIIMKITLLYTWKQTCTHKNMAMTQNVPGKVYLHQ